MIKLFRNIRKKLVAEGKTTNYLKYAIGEIFLVVIGILIALQVNNWNEIRKQNIQKDLIVQSLIRDLKMDTMMIDQTLNILKQDTTQVFGFIKQMSNDHITIDTLINIARFKFDPKVHVAVSFNNNTLKSLLSTGNLNILDKWLQDEILQLDVMHEDNISRTQLNLGTYVDQVISFERKYPLGDYGNISPHSKLAEAIWEKAQFEELGTYLNGLLAIRNVTNIYAIGQLNGIQEKTKEILLQFSDKQSKQ